MKCRGGLLQFKGRKFKALRAGKLVKFRVCSAGAGKRNVKRRRE